MLHVAERVVHPAHVPLEAEPETAQVDRPGDARPGGGLLGDHHDPGHALVAGGVDLLQERDRVEVLPPAERVGRPLAFLARVVEVEHRRDRVDPEPVDVELLEPVDRVGDEEVPDLGAAVVEDQRAPVRVRAQPGVGVLVERGPVELGQRPRVAREVRGHPVDDDPDARLVQGVDQEPEVVGRAEPGRRRVVRGDLVPPRAAERVLGHRQELDVGEPEVGDVGGQLDRELAVGQAGPPRAEVHLVDRHRAGQRLPDGALGQPVVVLPLVRGLVHDRAGGGRQLGVGRHRVGLVPPHPVGPADRVLVGAAGGDPGHEQLPDPGPAERAHRVRPPVPEVEVADEPDPARVRRPDGEGGAGLGRPRAERAPELLVPALADQVQVDLAERGKVPVGSSCSWGSPSTYRTSSS